MQTAQHAKEIYQSMLDRQATALMAGDVGALSNLARLPFRARTHLGTLELSKEEALHRAAELYCNDFLASKSGTLILTVDTARFVSGDVVVGHHTRKVNDQDGQLYDLNFSRMQINRLEGDWRIGFVENAENPGIWEALFAHDDGADLLGKRMVPLAGMSADMHLLQSVMDRVSTALLGADLDGLISLFSLPLKLTSGGITHELRTRHDMSLGFYQYQQVFDIQGVTDFVRHITRAERVGDNVIKGEMNNYLLRGAMPVVPRWTSSVVLRKERGRWLVEELYNSLNMDMVLRGDRHLTPKENADGTARSVAEYLLSLTGKGLTTGDFDVFASAFALPHKVSTITENYTIADKDHLRRAFEQAREHYRTIGMTDLERHCEAADFKSPTRIEATHVSHVMRNRLCLYDPYPVFSVIERIDGGWRLVSSDYAIATTSDTGPAAQTSAARPAPIT